MTGIDDLLGGGAAGKTTKFATIGDNYSGTVVSAEVRAYTDIQTGKPESWDDGSPKQQIVIGIQTDLRDPSIEDDDGVRYNYVKGWGKQKQSFRAAAQSAGGSPAVGDFYGVKYVGEEPSKTRGFNPSKLYEFTIRKANPLDAAIAEPAAPQAAPAAQAVVAPVATPGGGALTPQQEAQVRLFIEKSLTDEQIAAVTEGVTAADAASVRLQVAATSGGGF